MEHLPKFYITYSMSQLGQQIGCQWKEGGGLCKLQMPHVLGNLLWHGTITKYGVEGTKF